MNSEDMNDPELDAFLKGEDELSRRLKALPQPAPSAEFDAAILARSQAQMAREQRPAAANDASDGVASKAPMARLGLRWRVPAGIAATVLAGVLTHHAWQGSTNTDRVGEMLGSGSTNLTPSLPAPPVQQVETAPAPQEKVTPAPPGHRQPAARRTAPAVVEPPLPPPPPPSASMLEARPVSPPPTKAFSYSAPVFAAPAPVAAMATEERRTVEVIGRRNVAPVTAKSGELPTQAPDPKTWLAAIDAMLEAGLQRDTLEEWDKFRAAWPDYPVPAATREKINALRK
ncbi:MAG: hypothetical protein JWP34_1306 [Massilia sp.]|nr:hypothetical protein [Massilia sp.]